MNPHWVRLRRWIISLLFLSLCLIFGCSRRPPADEGVFPWGPLTKDPMAVPGEIGKYGQTLVAVINQEPKSFNRIVSSDTATADVTDRIFSDLIHINRETQQVEPALAKSWEFSSDGRTMILHLRQGLLFSDGTPLTAGDVVFTFQVLYDPKVNSPQADQLKVGGKPFEVKKLDSTTVEISFPKPVPAIERVFDSVFILPRHKLEAAYKAGNFASAWPVTSNASDVVGTGPFRFARYVPGQFIELGRNPNYWKIDSQGHRLPYLSHLILKIIPSRDTQFLNFKSGDLDLLNEVRAEDYEVLEREASAKNWLVKDLGPSLSSELLWFNQNPSRNRKTAHPYVDPLKLKWFTNQKFRQAVSYAIDRKSMVDLVFQGRATEAYGPLTASNRAWYNPDIQKYSYNLDAARQLLKEAGFHLSSASGKNQLIDGSNHPVRFSLITNAGNRIREKMGAMIQNDLEKIGIEVNFTPLEFSALISKITETFDYEACLLGPTNLDTDPSSQMNLWLSSAPNHQWFPNEPKPATPWEARIDHLMLDQSMAPRFEQRRQDFDEVQLIVSQQLPFMYLVSRNVLVAAKRTVGNFRPTILDHHTLWNIEQLYKR